ncbi:Medium-chain acyl-CoA ligase ACSF2 like protein [Argiope bruennichi]|uniref:Medium-chain acyl-CoA ligase ACSF2, mitochondrial n=1 Tax=Argiope bruennichi TaxID=94029 RepID=A0A8T0EUH1_ARGBR|nr:Medium-chain acyl-CoA ligase ACSF2 like protein [Argiope bruennichi]
MIDRSADRCGDKTAVISVHQNVSKTYSELRQEAESLASGLMSIGLRKGDKIALCSPNCYEWPLTQLAAAKAGLILVNINPAYQKEELEYCLKKIGCKSLVTWDVFKTQDYYKILCDIFPDLPNSTPGKLQSSKFPTLESIIMILNDKKSGVLNFKDVLDSGNKESDKLLSEIDKTLQFDDPANIQFTSGTTGTPRGEVLTHHSLVNNVLITGPIFKFDLLKPVACCHIPLFHSFGCLHASLNVLFHQGTCVFPSVGFDAISSLRAIDKHKCSIVFEHQLCYGMTETSTAIAVNRLTDDLETVAKGILEIIDYVEVKIMDSKGQVVPVNSQGELCARGHPIFLGYWDDEKKTAEVLDKTRWYHSGDLATMNEDGKIKIVGRVTDMINRGGENIYPLEVENFLNTHPAIQDAYICGVPDKRMGEEACAWVCLKEGMQLTEDEIKQFCKGKMSHVKIPRYIMFVEEFPKTQSGKVKNAENIKEATKQKSFRVNFGTHYYEEVAIILPRVSIKEDLNCAMMESLILHASDDLVTSLLPRRGILIVFTMNYFRIQKSILGFSKLHYISARCFSDAHTKIRNSYYFMPGDIMLSSLRLGDIVDVSADKCGDHTAVISVHQNISKTYSKLRDEAERLASGLLSIGLRKGDRIGLCAPNCYEWPLTQFAAAKAGLILVNINPASQSMELEFCLKKVDCKALVIPDVFKTQDYYKILCNIIPDLPRSAPGKLQNSKLPSLESIIMISDHHNDGVLNLKDVLDGGNKESDALLSKIEKSIQFDDPVNIQFTSGTTGTPKGAVLTHHNVMNNALLSGKRYGFDLKRPISLCHLPLFHSFGCVQASLATYFFQGTCVLPTGGFDAVASLKAIEKHKCSILFGTPTMYVDLIRNFQLDRFDIATLKQAVVGGAAPPASLVRDFKQILGITDAMVGYGATETSPAICITKRDDYFENIVNGVMKLIEYSEAKIVDSNGEVVPVNTQGELCARGHVTFLGYWDEEKKTAEVLDKARWYHTGDLATMNEYGFVKIVGRIKEMIIRGGENIYPQEVENFLNSHPAVLEVHVCGVPDQRMGEEACAWICLKEGMNLTAEQVKEFCKGKISHFKIPRYIMFVEEFPKTQSGKVKKFEMSKISIEKLKL